MRVSLIIRSAPMDQNSQAWGSPRSPKHTGELKLKLSDAVMSQVTYCQQSTSQNSFTKVWRYFKQKKKKRRQTSNQNTYTYRSDSETILCAVVCEMREWKEWAKFPFQRDKLSIVTNIFCTCVGDCQKKVRKKLSQHLITYTWQSFIR